ncbi:MAG TPA: menaquinone biosynthesis protein [Bryobacteraceae bacterium]|nr:menaquinone biosynthesis protein [Bryobacteraceae bacterium]
MIVSAVSYLNTWPLVWGFLHGPQQGIFDFRFDLPALCAAALEEGKADIGLVPCAELDRLGLDFLPGLGIACEGPVLSILLISRVPFEEIRTLAVDSGSRTSVALTRIVLAERYGCEPVMTRRLPNLDDMLAESDAALLIGDPALHLDPKQLPWRTLDLGAEWVRWSGLPMVFAVWAGHSGVLTPDVEAAFLRSYEWGLDRTEEMVDRAAIERGFDRDLAREYLTRQIVYRLGPDHLKGLALFREKVRSLKPASCMV